MNEFLEQFIIESRELVEQAGQDLLALENRPDEKPYIDSAFRAFHTLKGGAAIVDFAAMGRALHAAEDVLSAVRADKRKISSPLISACLACLDVVQAWLNTTESTGKLPDVVKSEAEADALLARFARDEAEFPESSHSQEGLTERRTSRAVPDAAAKVIAEQLALLATMPASNREGIWTSAFISVVNALRVLGRAENATEIEGLATLAVRSGDTAFARERIASFLDVSSPPEAETTAVPATDIAPKTFRVDGERIEALVTLTGELTVAKNALSHVVRLAQESENSLATTLRDQSTQLDRLVTSLQHAALGMRVMPLRYVFQRLQRLVRELAIALGKPARLVSEGEDTEADKAVVEALYEPLLHIIRNAMDHGIETPDVRAVREKPKVSTITLRGLRIGEQIVVEAIDDGGGIDIARIKSVALARGIVSEGTLADMDDTGVMNLIFEPGFSTASRVTAHSGRGVGLDVVRTDIEALGGQVVVDSLLGQGTTVRLTLPFSVMMTQVMTVKSGDEIFGIPLDAIVETVRIPRDRIQEIGAGQAMVHRGQTVPVINLFHTLGASTQAIPTESAMEATLLLVFAGGQLGALEVDRLGERMEVMLKPMPGLLAQTPGVAGTSLLGDGSVLIVLNIHKLFV